ENPRRDQRREALEQENAADDDEQELEPADERDQRQQPTERQRAAIAHAEPRASPGAAYAATSPARGPVEGQIAEAGASHRQHDQNRGKEQDVVQADKDDGEGQRRAEHQPSRETV